MVPETSRTILATLALLALLSGAIGAAAVSAQQTATPAGTPASATPTSSATPVLTHATVTIESEDGTPRFTTGAERTIRGETSLPAGTELEVRVQSPEPVPFVELDSATVREDGRFRASITIPDVTVFDPVSVDVSVRYEGQTLETVSGTLYPGDEAARTDTPASTTPATTEPTESASAASGPTAETSTPSPIGGFLSGSGVATAASGIGVVAVAVVLFGSTAFVLYRR